MEDLFKVLVTLANRNSKKNLNSWHGESNSKSVIRKLAGAQRFTGAPVKVVPGRSAPKLRGKSFHWINKSGDIVHFPKAYSAKFGKPIYVHSTIYVKVGKAWLSKNIGYSTVGKTFCYICNSPISDDEKLSDHGEWHINKLNLSSLK